jgi:aryl-alcohol dehydrogenase-like predicted oxidoreductase
MTAELGIALVASSPHGRGIFGGESTGPESLAEGLSDVCRPNNKERSHPSTAGIGQP